MLYSRWSSFLLEVTNRVSVQFVACGILWLRHKGRNFFGKKISQISQFLVKVAKLKSYFDSPKSRFAKINFSNLVNRENEFTRNFLKDWWSAKIWVFLWQNVSLVTSRNHRLFLPFVYVLETAKYGREKLFPNLRQTLIPICENCI